MASRAHPTRRTATASLTRRIAGAADRGGGFLVVLGILSVGGAVLADMDDRFRLIKESVVRTQVIAGFLIMAISVAFGGGDRLRRLADDRKPMLLAFVAVGWTAFTVLFSTHRAISLSALVTVIFAALLFLQVLYFAPNVPLLVFDALALTVVVNSVLAAAQEFQVWQPFESDEAFHGHLETTGLIDNPNVLGSYLAIASIALIIAARNTSGTRRVIYGASAAIGVGGVLVSNTRTALITLLAVAFFAGARRSMKWAGLTLAAILIALVTGFFLGIEPVRRVAILPFHAMEDLHGATSGRVIPSVIAGRMFRDHPITGIGPGTYGFNYMKYQSDITRELEPGDYRWIGTNFSEVHNDYMQVLAETGLPGLAILVAALYVVARRPAGESGDDDRARIGLGLGFPLAAGFIILALAQFPLQVAVMRHLFLTLGALAIAWRDQ
jgi:O-antigen ligase